MNNLRFREKEKRFYKKISVRKLKELILNLPLPKGPRDNSSYFLKRGSGLQDLKEHKRQIKKIVGIQKNLLFLP